VCVCVYTCGPCDIGFASEAVDHEENYTAVFGPYGNFGVAPLTNSRMPSFVHLASFAYACSCLSLCFSFSLFEFSFPGFLMELINLV
jgi:hypothetical protein